MTTIKIFLASSKELELERDKFASLINQLNRIFKRRGLELELVIWEYLDSSMSKKRKQDEYNEELRQCEICLVVFWNVFGDYTKEEFNIAYDGLCAGNNPKRLYVFFKEPAQMSDEMSGFKNSFADKYGHFYSVFDNADTLKLNFLLQLEIFKNDVLDISKFVSIENSCVSVDGVSFIDLRNVPFAANNTRYIELQQQIDKQRKRLLKHPDDIEEQQELHLLLEKRQNMEDNMMSLARKLSEQSLQEMSPRMMEARKLFDMGELQAVIKILDTVDILSDIRISVSKIKLYDTLRKNEMVNIEKATNELQLRIKAEKVLSNDGWISSVSSEYQTLIEGIRGYSDPFLLAKILFEAARFIEDYSPNKEVISYYTESIELMESLKDIPNSVLSAYGDMLFYAGRFFTELVYEIDSDPTEGEWMDTTNEKIHKQVQKRWKNYKKLANEYLERSMDIYNRLNTQNRYEEDIYYSLNALVKNETLHGNEKSERIAHNRLIKYSKESHLANEYLFSALVHYAITLYVVEDKNNLGKIIDECNTLVNQIEINSVTPNVLLDIASLYEMGKNYKKAEICLKEALNQYQELAKEDPYKYQESIASCMEQIATYIHWQSSGYKTNPETKNLLNEAKQIYHKLYDATGSNVYYRKVGHISNYQFELRLKERMDYCSYLFKSIQKELIQYFSSHLKSGTHTYNVDWELDCPIKNISTTIRKVRNKNLYKLSFTWEFDSWTTGYEYINMDFRREFSKDDLYSYLSSRKCYDDLCDYIVRGIDKGGHMD